MKYTYDLHPAEKPRNAIYLREELEQLTTLQLREICSVEKIVIGVAYKLNRTYIIDTIMKYRGQKIYTFINRYEPERLEWIFEELHNYLGFQDASKEINIPTRINLYKGLNTTTTDNYEVRSNSLSEGTVVLLDDNKRVCGVLNLKREDNRYFIISNYQLLKKDLKCVLYKNYSLGFLDERAARNIYDFYYNGKSLIPVKFNCKVKLISELVLIEIFNSKTTFVIDFGTSNTTAGAYIDPNYIPNNVRSDLEKSSIKLKEINKVKFHKGYPKYEYTEVFPTVISIKDCKDPSNVQYRFGYEAIINASKNSYNNPQSIYYGIKRWVNNYKKMEEISDEEGNIALISRSEIIEAYFKYIIKLGENQHKCVYKNIHITSPLKQKQQFIEMYKEILQGYTIEEETALDEAMAVLYNSISNQIENNNFKQGQEYKALIIDCGGGTTDLTSCNYYIEDNNITYELNIDTKYSNGENNFGGNNITYRIFQYVKILFSKYYKRERIIMLEEMFEYDLNDIYRYVDINGRNSVYNKFDRLYEDCENVIPTKFNEYKNSPSEDFMKIRSNFYFLWNLAEKIKIEMYETTKVSQTDFHIKGLKIENRILAKESWRINLYNKGQLKLYTELPQVTITKDEINMLIKGDIYYVVKKFMEPIDLEGGLQDFNFIKLTGQTCRIDIFKDALKEFIAGRVIQSARRTKGLQDYKLTCLEGAVKYQNAKNIGLIAPSIINNIPITPYKLIAYTHTGVEIIMMSSLEEITKTYGYVSRNIDTLDIELLLVDEENKFLYKYIINTDIYNFSETTYEETHKDYEGKIYQDDIDTIVNNEIKIFTYAYEDKWGFYVVSIARKDGVLLRSKDEYLSFENDEWELNFFNGV